MSLANHSNMVYLLFSICSIGRWSPLMIQPSQIASLSFVTVSPISLLSITILMVFSATITPKFLLTTCYCYGHIHRHLIKNLILVFLRAFWFVRESVSLGYLLFISANSALVILKISLFLQNSLSSQEPLNFFLLILIYFGRCIHY